MIDRLLFGTVNTFYSKYIFGENTTTKMIRLSHLNILVGANNSGKSRFLRELFKDLSKYNLIKKQRDIPFITDDDFLNNVNVFGISKQELISKSGETINELNSSLLNNSINLELSEYESEYLSEYNLNIFINNLHLKLESLTKMEFQIYEAEIKSKSGIQYNRYLRCVELASDLLQGLNNYLIPVKENPGYVFTYLPPNRTLRRFHKRKPQPAKPDVYAFLDDAPNPHTIDNYDRLDELIFKEKLLFDYFTQETIDTSHWPSKTNKVKYNLTTDPENIFTGEELYDRIFKLRNSTAETRKLLTDFEEFLSKSFFNNATVSLNSLRKDNIEDVFVKIGNSPEFPIQHLGDGIQALIILTFPLFEKKNENHLLFIEEPELFLHPGLQRILIETLTKFKKTQVFIVSHSNHILELSQEYSEHISVFTTHKTFLEGEEQFSLSALSGPSISPLDLLGVRNSSMMLVNCTIWVEGISDRLYYRKFLELYIKSNPDKKALFLLKEDIHYGFVEFGGNNIEHWEFEMEENADKINALRLTNKIFLIHDNDKGKKKRHELLKGKLHEKYYCLSCNEVENLLNPEILKRAISSYRIDKRKELEFKSFDYDSYKEENIGDFINKIVPSNEIKKIISRTSKKSVFKIRNKHAFAKQAIGELTDWDQLSQEAQQISKMLYDFIFISNFP